MPEQNPAVADPTQPSPAKELPLPSAAREFQAAHPDPLQWSGETWEAFVELGGAQ